MKALLLLTSATLIWCSSPAPVDPNAPSCTTACATLTRLGCDEAKPTADGASCAEVCANANDLPVACITQAINCDAAENCQ